MSNSVYIEVHRIEKKDPEQEQQFHITVSDNYADGLCTTDKDLGGLDILQHCKDYGSDENAEVCAIIDFVLENQIGVNINSIFYDWDEIKHIFDME